MEPSRRRLRFAGKGRRDGRNMSWSVLAARPIQPAHDDLARLTARHDTARRNEPALLRFTLD
jgi:hypothetical protein